MIEADARGLGGISAAEAFRAWSFGDRFAQPYYAILRPLPERSLPVFSMIATVAEAEGDGPSVEAVAWDELAADELAERVLEEVHEQVAAELNLDRAAIDIDQALIELGVDSVLTVGLRVRLNRRFSIDLPPTILWSNPTIRSLAEFLTAALVLRATADRPPTGPWWTPRRTPCPRMRSPSARPLRNAAWGSRLARPPHMTRRARAAGQPWAACASPVPSSTTRSRAPVRRCC